MAKQPHYLKEWRKHGGFTQQELADRMGRDRTLITHIEKGRRKYDQAFLEAAAEIFHCEPADLIVRHPNDPDGLWAIYDRMNPAQRFQLVEMAKVIARTGTEG